MELLASPTELQAWLQDAELDTGTAVIALTAASGHIRGETGQDFTIVRDDTVVFGGVDDDWLVLPQRPVLGVSAVGINGVTLAAGNWTLSGSRLYRWNGWNRNFVGGATSYGRAPTLITVTYDHGYEDVPDDVKGATLAVAADIVSNPSGLVAENIDDYSWRRSESASGAAAQLLIRGVVRRYGSRAGTTRLSR